jgi:hypothetical protein
LKVDKHIRRLDSDLARFESELKERSYHHTADIVDKPNLNDTSTLNATTSNLNTSASNASIVGLNTSLNGNEKLVFSFYFYFDFDFK